MQEMVDSVQFRAVKGKGPQVGVSNRQIWTGINGVVNGGPTGRLTHGLKVPVVLTRPSSSVEER